MRALLLLVSLVSLFGFYACSNDASQTGSQTEEEVAPQPSETNPQERPVPDVIGLIKPFQLTGVETELILEDVFTDPAKLASVETEQGLSAQISDEKTTLAIRITGDIGRYSNLRFVLQDGSSYDQLLIAPSKRPVTLRLRDADYREVAVKGEMNAWNTNLGQMELQNGVWEVDFELQPGDYQYIFVVDGKEMLDPKNPRRAANGLGGENSLLSLKQADPSRLPKLRVVDAVPGRVQISMENPGAVLAYWQNQQINAEPDEAGFSLNIPEEALDYDRSYIRVYSQNEAGTGNDLLLPLEQRQLVRSADRLSRQDAEAQIMYFVLVDRFYNGDPSNDQPVADERLHPLANYKGGDLEGVRQMIESGYFESLSVNSIWLSPITQNPEGAFQEYPEPHRYYSGYHGYWPVSSSKVDHRFGDAENMEELVASAHGSGINVLLDYVCNHVHEQHPIYQNHPEWATTLELDNGEMNIRIWEEQRLTTWFDTFLPSLDLSNPEVIDLQVDSTMYWIERFGLDGFRHDATKHIDLAFWRELTRRLKTEVMGPLGRPIYQIGETYGSRELIASYIGTGLLDAQFDFNLYFTAREVFARPETSFESLASGLRETFNYYGHHNSMGYISGNHDMPRFISLAGGWTSFDEDPRRGRICPGSRGRGPGRFFTPGYDACL